MPTRQDPKKKSKRRERAAHETGRRASAVPAKPKETPIRRPAPPPAEARVAAELEKLNRKLAAAKTPAARAEIKNEIAFFRHHHVGPKKSKK